MRSGTRRPGLLAGIALAAMLAACGVNEETSPDPGTVWLLTDVAGADLTGNGRTDIVTLASQQGTNSLRGYVRIYRQSQTGAFTSTQLQVGSYPWRLRIADVNGDNAPDLLVLDVVGTDSASDDVLYLLLQDPNNRGQFLPARTIASGLRARDFTTADINFDLARDIVIAGVAGGGAGATQLLQRPTQPGFFQPPTVLAIDGQLQKVTTGDYAGLGRDDLVSYSVLDTSAGANAPGQLAVNLSSLLSGVTGSGFYLTPGTVLASHTGVDAQALAVADVDGNGLTDVIACFTPISTAFQPKISVVLRYALISPEIIETRLDNIRGLDGFVIADLNGDGVADVATTGTYFVGTPATARSTTNILVHTLGGRYRLTASIDMPATMSRIGAADVDGDGLNDLLLIGGNQRAFVMYQSGTLPGTFLAPREL